MVDRSAFDPWDPVIQQCPHAFYAAMRREEPVFALPGRGLTFVTRYDLVIEALRDTEVFSSRFGVELLPPDHAGDALTGIEVVGYPQVPTMLTEDPPAHTRYRGLVSKAFTPRHVRRLEPDVVSISHSLIDDFMAGAGTTTIEFVRQFAVGLPVRVIARALNVPEDRLDDFKRWSDDSVAAIGADITRERRQAAQRGIVEFQHYFAALLEERRTAPQDDILTGLVQARLSPDEGGGQPLSTAEMLSILQQLLVAGNETTTKLLTEAMRLLGDHPDEWSRLQAEPERAGAVVEESLRVASPVQSMYRKVTGDTKLGGVAIPAWTLAVLVYGSANRDEAVFPEPDRFDPDRPNAREHLAFGRGIHFCLGASLARLEAVRALQVLAERIDSFRLLDTNTFEYDASFLLRGLKRLDLGVTAR